MPIKALFNNTTIASSDEYKIVEGRYYFPPKSVTDEYLQKNGNKYVSRWKGIADYYDLTVGNKTITDAALVYPKPKKECAGIKDYFSFGDDVEITKTNEGE